LSYPIPNELKNCLKAVELRIGYKLKQTQFQSFQMKLFSTILILALLSAVLIESSPFSSFFKFLRKKKGTSAIEKGTSVREEEALTEISTTTGEPLPNTYEMDNVLSLARSMLETYDPNVDDPYLSNRIRMSYYDTLVSRFLLSNPRRWNLKSPWDRMRRRRDNSINSSSRRRKSWNGKSPIA
jgi:hypothetical protein